MSTKARTEAIQVLKDAINEFESQKGSIVSGIQKLSRAAKLLNNEKISIWCEIQMGNPKYTILLKRYLNALAEIFIKKNENKAAAKEYMDAENCLKEIGLVQKEHYTNEEINAKYQESGGGYCNIGFIEEKYADIVRGKRGNGLGEKTILKAEQFFSFSPVE